MKNIITAVQMREADQHVIETEPIASIDLMEQASQAFVSTFMRLYPDKNTRILICCGTGNNGGDGLAIARLLQEHHYDAITVWIARFTAHESDDFATNFARLHHTPVSIAEFLPTDEFPDNSPHAVVIDAVLGSGLKRPLEGDFLRLARHINNAKKNVIAVDVPTGLRADGVIPIADETIFATHVIAFQRPKLSFFFPESAKAMERFHVVDIGLDERFIENMPSDFKLVEALDIRQIYRRRKPFSHKGTYGHALLIAGSESTMGAALLSCGASLYSGAGLTSACIPADGLVALNTRYPEVMYCAWNDLENQWDRFNAVGIGPGIGLAVDLEWVLNHVAKPMVFDADALTILANRKSLFKKLPKQSILTPHMKEFDRLFGRHDNWWDRVQTAKKQATENQLVIVLKNRYSFIALPDGRVLVNPTGNPAMASGGMGDVLTGMLTSFLAQGYPPEEATVLACYLHGASGDRLAADGMAVVPATTVIKLIPRVIGENLHQ